MTNDEREAQRDRQTAEPLALRLNDQLGHMAQSQERQRFEAWYDAQPDGRLSPWDVWQAASKLRGAPLNDADALALARKHLDHGLSWAPHITRCTDLEIRALIRAVETTHGIVA
jgi:hypothetical protein